MQLVLIGNYGVGNLGDEALREFFEQNFPEVEWIVLSANPTGMQVPRLPFGVRSLLTTPWWRTLRAIMRSQGVVFGGGSLFTDVESPQACVLWWWHARVARFLGRPVHLAFQGIGPFKTRVGESYARKTVAMATSLSVRDVESFDRVKDWEKSTEVVQTSDPGFASFVSQKTYGRSENVFIVIPRHNTDAQFMSTLQNLLKSNNYPAIEILLMQPNDPAERMVAEELQREIGTGVTVKHVSDTFSLMREVGRAGHVLTQRFHGALAALAAGVPLTIVPQSPGDKMSALQDMQRDPQASERLLERIEAGIKALRSAIL